MPAQLLIFFLAIFLTDQLLAKDCDSKIAVAPAKVSDPHLAASLAQQAITKLRPKSSTSCNPFLPYEATVEVFDIIGINSYFTRDIASLPEKQRRILIKETAATHILALTKTDPTLRADLYELKAKTSPKLISSDEWELDEDLLEAATTPTFLRYLALYTPNAFSIGATRTTVAMVPDERYEIGDTKLAESILPPIFSSISFTKISHPDSFDDSDYSFSLFPGVNFFAINQDDVIVAKEGRTEANQPPSFVTHVEVYGICQNINGQAELFWVMGTTYMYLGGGPCIYQSRREYRQPVFYLDFAARLGFGHRFFFSSNLFGFFELDFLHFSRSLYREELVHAWGISRATLGMGIYISDVESKFLNIWNEVF